LAKEAGPRDAVIIFFAGHGQVVNLPDGARAGFLLPFDADVSLDDVSDPG
jgi:uncharacterized caspase-like protein